MLFKVVKRALSFIPGIINIERHNGIKKWFMSTGKRDAMDTETLDKLLRMFENSPAMGSPELAE